MDVCVFVLCAIDEDRTRRPLLAFALLLFTVGQWQERRKEDCRLSIGQSVLLAMGTYSVLYCACLSSCARVKSDTNKVVHPHKRDKFRYTNQNVPMSVSHGHLSSIHAQLLKPKAMYTSLPISIPTPVLSLCSLAVPNYSFSLPSLSLLLSFSPSFFLSSSFSRSRFFFPSLINLKTQISIPLFHCVGCYMEAE